MNTIFSLPLYVGIILQHNNTIFLVQRCNTNWMSGFWNFPGGLVEKNETLIQAAIREAKEEIGIEVDSTDFELVHVIHVHKNQTNTQDILGIYFRAKKWTGTPCNNERDKITDAQWFNLNNVPNNITEHALLAINGLVIENNYSESGR